MTLGSRGPSFRRSGSSLWAQRNGNRAVSASQHGKRQPKRQAKECLRAHRRARFPPGAPTSRRIRSPRSAVIIVCALWFALGLATEVLTAILSILAITLTQMVLNRQNEREADAHRRDVAMHAKIDELVIAMKGARNEMAGIEELDEEDIEELKDEAKEAIDEAGERRGDHHRAAAKRAIDGSKLSWRKERQARSAAKS